MKLFFSSLIQKKASKVQNEFNIFDLITQKEYIASSKGTQNIRLQIRSIIFRKFYNQIIKL